MCGIVHLIGNDSAICHVEGIENEIEEASGHVTHLEGYHSTAFDAYCYVEGYENTAGFGSNNVHVSGNSNNISGTTCHGEGGSNIAGFPSDRGHVEGLENILGNFAGHVQGRECEIENICSSAGGWESRSVVNSQWSWGSGRFSGTPGALGKSAQCKKLVFRNYCPAGMTTTLYVGGQGSSFAPIIVRNDASWSISGMVVARSYNGNQNDGNDVRAWKVKAVVDRTSGTDSYSGVKLVGQTVTPIYQPNGTITISWYLDNSSGVDQPYLRATVSGSPVVNWYVVACWDITQVLNASARIQGE